MTTTTTATINTATSMRPTTNTTVKNKTTTKTATTKTATTKTTTTKTMTTKTMATKTTTTKTGLLFQSYDGHHSRVFSSLTRTYLEFAFLFGKCGRYQDSSASFLKEDRVGPGQGGED